MTEIYQPAEDSALLLKEIKQYAHGEILDLGTGSGVQAFEAAKYCKQVYAADISTEAVTELKKKIIKYKIKNITALKSDLFSAFRGKKINFNLILFNPPYSQTRRLIA